MGIREIIFRAKVKFERLISAKPNEKKEQVVKWVYWGVYGQTVDEIGNAFPYNVDGLRVVYIDTAQRFIIPETVGQYTGLTDKNGKKIFEGDIVDYDYFGERKIGKIFFNGCGYEIENKGCFLCIQSADKQLDCEVIGNIHDNPELLESDDDKL